MKISSSRIILLAFLSMLFWFIFSANIVEGASLSIPIFLNKTPSDYNETCLNESVCFNASFNTIVNCDVYLNNTEMLGVNNITELSYCNSTPFLGFWNISAICNNFTDSSFNNTTYWNWQVIDCNITPTPTPTPIPNLFGYYPYTHYLVSYNNSETTISLSNQSGYIFSHTNYSVINITLWRGEEIMTIWSEITLKLVVWLILTGVQLYTLSFLKGFRIITTFYFIFASILLMAYAILLDSFYLDMMLLSVVIMNVANALILISEKISEAKE